MKIIKENKGWKIIPQTDEEEKMLAALLQYFERDPIIGSSAILPLLSNVDQNKAM